MATNDDLLARRALLWGWVLNLTGPLTVFWSASAFVKQQDRHGYARHTVSLDGGLIVTSEGVTIETLPLAEFEGAAIDTIVVPARSTWSPRCRTGAWWIGWRSTPPRRGARHRSVPAPFLLAEAGLLSAMFIRAWLPRKSAFDSRAAGLPIF
jgi:transcriptional regulator GlxA family with amidase domain